MGRSPCCDKVGLKKGPWTSEEDQKLLAYIEEHGHGNWRSLPAKAGNVHATWGLQRCGKSCRLRWTNYLRPDIKRGKFTLQEEQTIIQLHALLGNRWSAIAAHLPKRTDNEIKNYWNTHLKKRLTKMGIDPVTHKPKDIGLGIGQSRDAANISHMAQWESARLEAEARLVRGSKLVTNPYQIHQLGSLSSARLLNKVPPCLDVLKAWQSAWTTTTTNNNNNQANKVGHHGGDVLSSLFNSNPTLESPTSTLNFSENNMMNNIAAPIGFVDNLSTIGAATNYIENSGESEIGITKEDWKCLGNQNVVDEHHATYNNIADTLRLPSFMESFTDDQIITENAEAYSLSNGTGRLDDDNVDANRGGDFEDNKNYWNNIYSNVI